MHTMLISMVTHSCDQGSPRSCYVGAWQNSSCTKGMDMPWTLACMAGDNFSLRGQSAVNYTKYDLLKIMLPRFQV